MNQQAPIESNVSSQQHKDIEPRLHGRWFLLIRVGWLVIVVLAIGLFIGSIPLDFANLRTLCRGATSTCLNQGQLTPGDVRRLHELGLSIDFYAAYSIVLMGLAALGYWLVAAFLFWRKSDDRLALLAVITLATFPVVFNPGFDIFPFPWGGLAHFFSFLGSICIVLFFYVFPGGHFVPRWTRWVLVVALVYWGFGYFLPFSSFNPFSRSPVLNVLTYLALLGGIVIVQIYRYRRVSTPAQRQQTRWVVFAATLGVGGYLALFTLALFFPTLFLTGSLGNLIKLAVLYGLALLVPISLGLAILRSGLWDIDLIIHRTLVYGTLTAILGLVYIGLVIGLSTLLQSIMNQDNSVAIVLSTLSIVTIFRPLRYWIQQVIDRRFYRRKYNAARTLTAFSAMLYQEVDLDHLRDALLAVVHETMQPAHVSLWLRPTGPNKLEESLSSEFLPLPQDGAPDARASDSNLIPPNLS